jgi:O-antigen/teichoic acid export membrane protein
VDRPDSSPPRPVPRQVWNSTGWLVLGRLWGSTCTLVTLYVLSRHLDTSQFGRFTFYLALFLILDSFVDLGTGQVTVRWTAPDPGRLRPVLTAARRVRMATASLGLVAVGLLTWGLDEEGAGWILLAALYPLTHTLELTTTVLKNHISWARVVLVRAIAATSSLTLVLCAVAGGVSSPAPFLLAVAGGSTLGNVILHLVSRGYLPPAKPHSKPESALRLLREAIPIGLAGLCQQTYFWIDNAFVRPICGQEELGRYNLAVRLMSFGIMAAVYAAMASLPWLTREHNAGRLGPAVARLAAPMFLIGGLATGTVWGLPEPILGLFGEGASFTSAAPALRWLMLGGLAVYAGAPLLTALVASGSSTAVLRIAAIGLFINLLGNSLLVPRMGIEGAALATLVTEAWVVLGAAATLVKMGARPTVPGKAWLWLGGPLGFALGYGLSLWARSVLSG